MFELDYTSHPSVEPKSISNRAYVILEEVSNCVTVVSGKRLRPAASYFCCYVLSTGERRGSSSSCQAGIQFISDWDWNQFLSHSFLLQAEIILPLEACSASLRDYYEFFETKLGTVFYILPKFVRLVLRDKYFRLFTILVPVVNLLQSGTN